MPRGILRTMQPFEISHSCVTRSLWNVFKYMVNGLLRWIYVYNKLCRGYSFLFLNASELSQGKPVIQDIFLVWFFVVGTICLQRDETSWNSQNTRCFHEVFLFPTWRRTDWKDISVFAVTKPVSEFQSVITWQIILFWGRESSRSICLLSL